jgi:hypothetical protein
MGKFFALTAVVLAFLVVPALASAAPTATQITTPSTTHFVMIDKEHPGVFHVAGTTSGGTGNIDLVCYGASKTPVIAGNVPVANGAFGIDIPLDSNLIAALTGSPPFCMLRAVPAGTLPPGAPDQPSTWSGVFIGFGEAGDTQVGLGYEPTSRDASYDYFVGQAQSGAYNDYYSSAGCALCDTWLFVPGSLTVSNAIWWSNSSLGPSAQSPAASRAFVRIDGADAYTARSAYNQGVSHLLVDNSGFPAVTKTYEVNQANGDLTVDEKAPYTWCAEDRAVFPPTGVSCSTFADTGVAFEREIEQTHSGQMVTIVDHWKSADGKTHDLDAIYDDQAWSGNSAMVGHEGRLNFSWTPDGFTTYKKNTQMPLPSSVPASVFVKTDATVGVGGDNKNPWGAMTYGSMPSEVKVVQMSDTTTKVNDWSSRYRRTIPAGGEITIVTAYTDALALPDVDILEAAARKAVAPPALHVDEPADGATVDAPTVHVAGTASSLDGEVAVHVNGTLTAVDQAGHWVTDVPLNEGDNQILVSAANDIGAGTNAIVHVTRPAAPVVAPTTTPTATPVVAGPAPVRCVVPKLRGKTIPKAKRLLKKAHCRLGKVSRKASKNVKPGRIVATRFKVGSRHRAGARVRVTIAKARAL